MEPRYNEPLYNEVLDITEIEPRHNGRDPFDQNFGPKLSGSVRSNWKRFEETGPPFDVDRFSRSERSESSLNGSRSTKPLKREQILSVPWRCTALPQLGSHMERTRSQRTLIGRSKNALYWSIAARTNCEDLTANGWRRMTQLQRYNQSAFGVHRPRAAIRAQKWKATLHVIGNYGTWC